MKSSLFIIALYRILRTVEKEAGLDELDARSRTLLLLIAEGDTEGAALNVRDLVRNDRLGTPPTVYSALNTLETQGWIERREGQVDARTRALCLTTSARKIFARMSADAARAFKALSP